MAWPWAALDGQIEYDIAAVKVELQTISHYDMVVFQRQEMPQIWEAIRATQSAAMDTNIQSPWIGEGLAWSDASRINAGHRVGRKVVFDIDDDAINVPWHNPNYMQWGKDKRKIANMVTLLRQQGRITPGGPLDRPIPEIIVRARANLKQLLKNIAAADAVTVTTPWLRQVYSRYNDKIYILPNYAVPSEWEHVQPQPHDGIHIGWAGGPTHYSDIKVFVRPVKQILDEYPHVKLVLAGYPVARRMFFDDVPEERIITYPFMEEWRQNLATFDVILAPSDDNKFNAGKSAIRVYEGLCATRGRAAVVGSETTYGHTIRALGCGFVCKSPADWLKGLKTLVEDEGRRKEFGERGYKRMMATHTYECNAWQWLEVYKRVLNG